MRIAFSLWTAYLASKLPCPLSGYSVSREHVIPKSLFPPVVTNRSQNIIPMPRRLNNIRGNRKYTENWKDGYLVYSCDSCPSPGFCRGAGVVSPEGFVPPESLKGVIARSVLKSIEEFPSFAEKIDSEVLDYNTAIKWDREHPMSIAEQAYRSNSS